MKSQAEIGREKRIKTAFDLANRAMQTHSQSEKEACESQLNKIRKKYGISDQDIVDYAKADRVGGRKSEKRQQGGGGSSAQSDGFYYRDQRDRRRETEEREEDRRKQAKAQSDADKRQQQREFEQWQAENKRRARDEWNQQFERKYGKPTTKSGWRPENKLAEEKSTGEKFVGFINSLFGV